MMNLKTLVVVLAFIVLCNAECNTQTFQGGKFTRCQQLNSEYDFYWRIEGEDVILALNLRGYTNPWLALGISVNGGMKGGDIALAQKVNGKYTLEDRFGIDFVRPLLDTMQNLELISATTENQETTIIYKRALVPCDIDQDQPILANLTQVIFAYGEGEFDYHGPNHRGTVIVDFHKVVESLPLPSTYSIFNVTMDNYELPGGQVTTYACVSMRLPSDDKYHIVRWRPVIKNPANIHHIVIFGCYSDQKNYTAYQCPMAPTLCPNVMVVWTVGQKGDDFLGDFAIPMGKDVTAGSFIVLQMHYNNPPKAAGIVDSSGIELFYTTQRRPYDVGTVPMSTPWQALTNKAGVTTNPLVLPPGKKENYRYTRCHSECTQSSIPAEGITMINWFPHMHRLGSKIWLSHIRNGVELPEIHRDDHYDFERQQNFPVSRTILPGDSLIMNCVWNTEGLDVTTYGGEETDNEMCIGIFQYYPATAPPSFTRCTDLHEYFNTTGNDQSYATCPKNPTFLVNPLSGTNFTGGATPVIANPDYVHLPARSSTCAPPTNAPNNSSSSLSLGVISFVLCIIASLIL